MTKNDYIVWWEEDDSAPARVRARNPEQAAVLAEMRRLSKWDYHENVRDPDSLFVADAGTGITWRVSVKISHEVEAYEVTSDPVEPVEPVEPTASIDIESVESVLDSLGMAYLLRPRQRSISVHAGKAIIEAKERGGVIWWTSSIKPCESGEWSSVADIEKTLRHFREWSP